MISFGVWIAGLLGKSVTTKQAKTLALVVVIPLVLVCGALMLWAGKSLYDRGLRKQVLDQRAADIATQVVKADRAANADQVNRMAEIEKENERLEQTMDEAEREDPAKGETKVGPVQQSYFDNLPKRRR